ncbi:hypothetical protein KC921_02970 [Candidatus Woesebacteria bacterium]|nr:hypothetical protein [Candidatus Woesebacteria bacterium]
MPKAYFWPAALVVMGLIFLANQVGLLPKDFWNLWPLILIVVGLGGLLTADRTEWLVEDKPKKVVTKKRSTKRKK